MKIERLPRNYTLLTDEYEFTMAETVIFKMECKDEIAAFDVFFRKVPNKWWLCYYGRT